MIAHHREVVASLEARVVTGEEARAYGDAALMARFRPPSAPTVQGASPDVPPPLRLRPEIGFSSKALVECRR